MTTTLKKLWHWGMALPLHKQVLLSGVFALLLIVAAFVLEYGFNAKPCHLCWMQRYGHWVMAGFGLVGGLLGAMVPLVARLGFLGVVGAALYGLWTGVYQVLVQFKIVPAPQGCSSANMAIPTNVEDFMAALQNPIVAPPCDKIDFTILGLTLAAWNAIIMAVMLVVLFCAFKHAVKNRKRA